MPNKENLKILANISRFLVGGLFIFSGFVKIVDPIGTAIKMEKYFHIFSENIASFFDVFVPAALFLSVFMVSLEIVLGVALLMLYRIRGMVWVLLALIIYFTILTFYTHLTGEPKDCGCFGDFLKLTPFTSFIKDVVLLVMILVILLYRNHFKSKTNNIKGTVAMIVVTVVTVLFAGWNIDHLPVIDFRAYAVGNSIQEKMNDGIPDSVQTVLTYKHTETGELKEMSMDEYMKSKIWENKVWEYDTTQNIILKEGKPNSITGFNLVNEATGMDDTEAILKGKHLLVSIKDMSYLYEDDQHKKFETFIVQLQSKGVEVEILNSSSSAAMEKLAKTISLKGADIYTFDQDESKAMIRAKVGFVLLNDGIVKGKWHINDFPSVEEVLNKVE